MKNKFKERDFVLHNNEVYMVKTVISSIFGKPYYNVMKMGSSSSENIHLYIIQED